MITNSKVISLMKVLAIAPLITLMRVYFRAAVDSLKARVTKKKGRGFQGKDPIY